MSAGAMYALSAFVLISGVAAIVDGQPAFAALLVAIAVLLLLGARRVGSRR